MTQSTSQQLYFHGRHWYKAFKNYITTEYLEGTNTTLHFRGFIIINLFGFFSVLFWRWSKYFWSPWCIAAFLIRPVSLRTSI